MMPQSASPDNELSAADPISHHSDNEPPVSNRGDSTTLDASYETATFKLKTNGHVEPDATPKTNGHVHSAVNGAPESDGEGGDGDGPPAKKRRTRDATPPPKARKIKPESPPWKRIDADGPTSFSENGRRKSGRINTLPLELLPPSKKRRTRQSLNGTHSSSPQKPQTPINHKPSKTAASSQKSRPASRSSHTRTSSMSATKNTHKKTAAGTNTRSSRRRTPSPPPPPARLSTRSRRLSRLVDSSGPITSEPDLKTGQDDVSSRSPRITLRVGRSGVVPLVHPDQVRKRPKIGTSFEDFWQRAGDIPVEDGGLLASEDGPLYTEEAALKDARIVLEIEAAVEPGGILSRERCSLFLPEGVEEPPRQWARQDHMVKAMANFRKLLLAEQQRHRSTAKKLAEACREEWVRRQPRSAEDLAAEAREKWILRYRMVVKALFGTWENVRAQVNRQRLQQWEAEEQKRVKAALNEAVNLSEQKLQARQAGLDSEFASDEELGDMTDNMSALEDDMGESNLASGESDDEDDAQDEDSDIMSSSEDDEQEDQKDGADEGLTQEQLRAKYANIPDVKHKAQKEEPTSVETASDVIKDEHMDDTNDTSDESVDMDDDLGSSDMDSEIDEDEDHSSDDESDSGEETGGLLGMFFGKSELREMKNEVDTDSPLATEDTPTMLQGSADLQDVPQELNGVDEDIVDDEDEVSLIHHPDSTDGDDGASGVINDVPDSNVDYSTAATDQTANNAKPTAIVGPGEDLPMTDFTDVPPGDLDPVTDLGKEPLSPETEPVTNHASPINTQSPPTSETKPSDVDLVATGDTNGVEPEAATSLSPSTQTHHKTEIPFLLRGTLREYQHDGLDWLAGLYANSTNGILADEMGLGKTIQTIALLAHLACHHEVWGPHLVIVPTSVMLNWEMEFKKWCPGFKILAYYGSQEERKRKRQGWNNDDIWNVCITSYQLVLQDQQVFKRRRWHYMILDEAHNIKNFKSQRWQTLLGFNTQARLLLTGTPLQNNLTELWSLLFFLMPAENGVGGFADLQEFHDWFHKPESQILESGRDQMDDEARAIITKLHKVLRPYLLRRLKADVEKQMPGKYEHVEFCRLSKRQRELYDGFLSRNDTKATLSSGNYLSIINCLMQLRKVCNHPDLFVDRPIMTSFRMKKSVASDYTVVEQKLRRSLMSDHMSTVDLGFLNLVPTQHEHLSSVAADRVAQLSSHRALMDLREAQKTRAQAAYTNLDPSTVESTIAYLESAARWGRFEELQHCVYLNALRRQQRPVYGANVVQLLNIDAHRRTYRQRPKVPRKIMAWFEDDSPLLRALTPSLDARAEALKTTIEKFACVTPAVVTRDLEEIVLGRKGIEAFTDEDLKLSAPVRWAPFLPKQPPNDPWHEARMRSTIQFPDKRLLQFDCGKLQVLDKLLRKLQSGGHRALIFTQMTKVLDVLEQFLNIHGHKYLRLDGATKVEQRQILTDRFNNDPRILCFILSTRSGGLGINLTGADTVIFYDQDWNPAMDKQCQDRCHRIGQTRDVHIYRLISEHTIEANILRKASQKQMLDDVVIQEGEFTTDHFNKVSVTEMLDKKMDVTSEGVSAADAALDRVLGGPGSSNDQRTMGRVLEQAEDKEDVAAARVAEKEIQADDADFTERPSGAASGASTTRQGTPASKSVLEGGLLDPADAPLQDDPEEVNAWGEKIHNIDEFMLGVMAEQLKHTKLEIPKDKKKGKKKGKDTRKR